MRLALALVGLAFCGCSSAVCHPAPDPASRQYVVGYGSLMQNASRRRTSPGAGPAVPVDVTGYRRGWYQRSTGAGLGTTFLAVVPDPRGSLNAVIYEVQVAELDLTDRREQSYCRLPVAPALLRRLAQGGPESADGEIWIYALDPQNAAVPSRKFPIVQSYVDVFIGGCLEQEERFGLAGFSVQCLRTTAGWSRYWVNDRVYPRRAFVFEPRARQIDALLAAQIYPQWSRSHVEGN